MTMTDVAISAAPAPPPDEPAIEVDPQDVQLDFATQCRRHWFCRLPSTMIADDLKTPTIWRRVMQNPGTALAMFDELFLIAHDQSWAATGVVVETTQGGATLAMLRIASIEKRMRSLMNDGVYEVRWNGRGFVVFRLKDGQAMTNAVQSELIANEELVRLYPRKAS